MPDLVGFIKYVYYRDNEQESVLLDLSFHTCTSLVVGNGKR